MQLAILLFLIALVGTMWGRTRYLKIYGQETSNLIASRITGEQLATAILRRRGILGVSVTKSRGVFADFYHPEQKRITLAPQHFGGSSYSALALAALQAGKAIQHYEGHRPLLWRTTAVRWSIFFGVSLFILGVFAIVFGGGKTLLPIIVLFWSLLAFWNFLTIPTEIDAALRAKKVLEDLRAFRNLDERVGVERVMGAASTAYIDGVSVLGSWIALTFLPSSKKKAS